MSSINAMPREGDLYKIVRIGEHTFELRFGFYAEFERKLGEPVVVYPNLKQNRFYTPEGYRIVTAIQDPCECYRVSGYKVWDECCNDCDYYRISGEEIGICTCPANSKDESP